MASISAAAASSANRRLRREIDADDELKSMWVAIVGAASGFSDEFKAVHVDMVADSVFDGVGLKTLRMIPTDQNTRRKNYLALLVLQPSDPAGSMEGVVRQATIPGEGAAMSPSSTSAAASSSSSSTAPAPGAPGVPLPAPAPQSLVAESLAPVDIINRMTLPDDADSVFGPLFRQSLYGTLYSSYEYLKFWGSDTHDEVFQGEQAANRLLWELAGINSQNVAQYLISVGRAAKFSTDAVYIPTDKGQAYKDSMLANVRANEQAALRDVMNWALEVKSEFNVKLGFA